MLYPFSLSLSTMAAEPTDPLLNAWRMQWVAHAFLRGPEGVAGLFDANIFYPYPLTLAYSEHFLMPTALVLPALLLADSHLFGMNLSGLLTFALTGYGMYLLVATWTGSRWAGLLAGLLFAFSPQRFGQLNHLELLTTQWMPLALLALHWTLTRPGRRYPFLFALFFNLQALSGFHYTLNLTIACALLALVYALTGRIRWRDGLWAAAALSIGATLLLNWPVWRLYLRFNEVMGAVRTPGEIRIYSAAMTDYLTTIPHNLLYGWTFGRWQPPGHQFQPLMPVGVVGLLLALSQIVKIGPHPSPLPLGEGTFLPPSPKGRGGRGVRGLWERVFLLLLCAIFLLLSFGLNEMALGPDLAPLLRRFSPYGWLYEHLLFIQGIRVPGRFGMLVAFGLAALAGQGAAMILAAPWAARRSALIAGGLAGLILLEAWSAPLVGPEFPAGEARIPPVYPWLRRETAPDEVLLELPFRDNSEFLYEYYASHHWRRMANGGTGYTPPIYERLRYYFESFPDTRSVDVIQQMGIDRVILHPATYHPDTWQRVLDDLPRYLPAVEQINQVGDDLVLRIASPTCRAGSEAIEAALVQLGDDAVLVTYNRGSAAFVADVHRASRLDFAGGAGGKNFIEPLVTPPGGSQTVVIPLGREAKISGAWLATLDRTVVPNANPPLPLPVPPANWQPLGLKFTDGPELTAYSLGPDFPPTCGALVMGLRWHNPQPDDVTAVELLDPFGRVVAEAGPFPETPHPNPLPGVEGTGGAPPSPSGDRRKGAGGKSLLVETRAIPLPGSLPPGRYGLRVRVYSAATERSPMTDEGVPIPPDQIPPVPVIIHPAAASLPQAAEPVALFGEAISLLAGEVKPENIAAGDWLRVTLTWQAEQPIAKDLTVFVQLLGPDGQVWGQRDNQPKGGWYGTSLWLPGRPVADDYAFQVQPGAPPGLYRVIAGLYDNETLVRLPASPGGDFAEIGTVVVE
jgi:hypothetical protein